MRKAFTFTELVVCIAIIAIIAIICAITIPNIIDIKNSRNNPNTDKTIEFSSLMGKIFNWNSNETIVVNYDYPYYTIVLKNSQGGMVNVKAHRQVIMDAYLASLPQDKQVEKQ